MKWHSLKRGMFVEVWFHDHCGYYEEDEFGDRVMLDEKAPADTELVVVRGQVKSVNSGSVMIEGCWMDSGEIEFGDYAIVRGAVKRLEPLPPGTSFLL